MEFLTSRCAPAVALTLIWCGSIAAQMPALRARIESDAAMHFAGESVRVRFSLTNTSDAPIELKLRRGVPAPEGAAVLLSDHHVFNFENEQGVWLTPAAGVGRLELASAGLAREPGPINIVLGPRTTIAREVDLLRCFPRLKTAGLYDLVWRPYGGAVGSNALRLRVLSRRDVVLKTDRGEIVLELLYDKAPETCLHLLKLVDAGFYDGLTFHRVAEGVLIQGGGLDAAGNGRHAAEIPAEFAAVEQRAGVVSMARKIDPDESAAQPPRKGYADSARSQFFISLTRIKEWDGRFTAFARVREGLDVAERISRLAADPATGKPREAVVILKATARDARRP